VAILAASCSRETKSGVTVQAPVAKTNGPASAKGDGEAASRPQAPRDTLSSIPELAELFDGDTTNLAPRFAAKLARGSRFGVQFAIQQLGKMGERAVPEILRVLEPLQNEDQQFAAITNCCQALNLTKTRDPRALAALGKLIHHKSGSASSEALRTLGYLGDPSSLAPLREAFDSSGIEQRVVIVRAIGRLEGADADAALLAIANDEGIAAGFRMDAVDALAVRPLATAESYLRKLVDQPRPAGEKAIIALVATRDPEIVARARRLAMSWNDPALRGLAGLAVAALASIGEIDPALAALRDADPQIRVGLGLVGLKNAIRNASPSGELRARIVAALRDAERYPEREGGAGGDPTNLDRIEAMRCLVLLGEKPTIARDLADLASGDPQRVSDSLTVVTDKEVADRRSTPYLLQALEKAPLSRKRGFMQALGRLRDPAAVAAIANYLAGPTEFSDGNWLYEYAALQLANLGDAGVAALLDALAKTKDPERRRAIAEGISHSSGARALEALRAIAADTNDDPEVRAVAIRILPDLEGEAAAGYLKRLLASEPDARIRRLLNFTLHDRY
jgi:hypothetical protein